MRRHPCRALQSHELRDPLAAIGIVLREELLVLLVRDRHIPEVVRAVAERWGAELPYLFLQRPPRRPTLPRHRLFHATQTHQAAPRASDQIRTPVSHLPSRIGIPR